MVHDRIHNGAHEEGMSDAISARPTGGLSPCDPKDSPGETRHPLKARGRGGIKTAPVAAGGDAQASGAGEASVGEAGRTYTQDEVARMIEARLAAERRDAAARLEAARAEGRDEAERLGRMSADERLRYEQARAEAAADDRSRALDAREAAIERRELAADARGRLSDRGLPGALIDCLDLTSADALSASLDGVERAFRHAVQAGVDARLSRGGVRLKAGAGPDPAALDDAAYYASVMKSRG